MGIACQHCGSTRTRNRGKSTTGNGVIKQRYSCNVCGKNSYAEAGNKFTPTIKYVGEKFVITAAQNNCELNHEFYESLLGYCKKNKARLLIIPYTYKANEFEEVCWEHDDEYTMDQSAELFAKLRVLGNIQLLPTLEDPLSGIDPMSKGDSLIIGHPQLRMRTLPVNSTETPAILTTTGVITKPYYTTTKQGEKAKFNHSYSAVVVECDSDCFHIRSLNADSEGGFFDIDGYYSGNSYSKIDGVQALVTGDEHAIFVSPEVAEATYFAKDSIVNVLKPEYIVRHDILDCYSVSHHHQKNFFTRYAKHITDTDSIEAELNSTLSFLELSTPKFSKNIIVASNHNDHLTKWLNEADPKQEPWNAKVYHFLMWNMLENVKTFPDGSFEYPNPFQKWCEYASPDFKMTFSGRDTSLKICDIEVSNHGDVGLNGSRGSIAQYAKLAHKCIIGHSHSPGIKFGCYQVGTSSKLKLEYNRGPSAWLNTHCIIYNNGKRQLINIVNGKWRKS